MGSSNNNKLWHPSRGIVFANGGRGPVVYPQLPLARHFHGASAPAIMAQSESEALNASLLSETTRGEVTGVKTQDVQSPSSAAIESLAAGLGKASVQDDTITAPAPAIPGEKEEPTKEVDEEDCKPPFTPLEYKIPDDLFREAKLAVAGSPQSFWSFNLYRKATESDDALASGEKVKVHYCKSRHTTERVLQQYFAHEKVLGFDLEWAPDATKAQGPRRNICLVQLASSSRIALFHLALYPKKEDPDLVAPTLKKIMEDPEITKMGVWIKGDCTRLRNFLGIDSKGIFELSHLYKLVKYSTSGEHHNINKKLVSLATQVQEYLCLPIFKGQDVRSSDWSKELRMDQVIYSASDAYAAIQLYAILNHKRQQLSPTPPMPYHAELNQPIRLADGVTIPTADDTPDLEPKDDDNNNNNNNNPSLSSTAKYLRSLGASVRIEVDDPILTEPVIKDPPASKTPKKDDTPPKDARVTEAEVWAAQYRVSHPKTRAAAYILRAYYLWHNNKNLNPEAIAGLLRDPPLQTNTVVNYIMEAIRLERENLPFEKARMKTDVLDKLPKEIVSSRYKTLYQLCQLQEQPSPSDKQL
ncbi:putative Werner syndrome helicase [Diplogelasinospora grovesii]|uniref:Werner syndrome helicase n=1 Tax=Diplogelasinospora grovesii TaxID=303347 RepID=A0AAN6NFK9_9PEZI|nr:putative Werner syndrome helicase [Diplogelasinospora grovesii]